MNEEVKKDHEKTTQTPSTKGGWRSFFSLGEVGGYFFRKKDKSRPTNINLRMMHGVNKISIIIFLLGILYLVFKLAIKPHLM
jgi:hypothetical protein